jgi:hypothetical protein
LEPDQVAFENRNGREVIGVEKCAGQLRSKPRSG